MPRKKGSSKNAIQVSITTSTVLKVIGIVALAIAVFLLRDIVLLFLVAVLIAALIDPFARWGKKYHLPKGLSVLLVYLGCSGVVATLLVLLVPAIATELGQLSTHYAGELEEWLGTEISIEALLSSNLFSQNIDAFLVTIQEAGIAGAIPEFFGLIAGAFGSVFSLLLVLVLVYYLVVEEDSLRGSLLKYVPKDYAHYFLDSGPILRHKLGIWLRAQILLMVIVFAISYTILLLFGIPYALVLAIMAGLFELVPFLGPVASAVPAILIGLTVSPFHGLLVAIAYFVIQQIEGDFLTPKIMQKVGGMNPIVSILALIAGFHIAGILGAVLAIPFVMVVTVYLQELLAVKKKKKRA